MDQITEDQYAFDARPLGRDEVAFYGRHGRPCWNEEMDNAGGCFLCRSQAPQAIGNVVFQKEPLDDILSVHFPVWPALERL